MSTKRTFSPEQLEARRLRSRQWAIDNKEKKAVYDKAWREKNPEKGAEYSKRRNSSPDRKSYLKEWREKNREKCVSYTLKWRSSSEDNKEVTRKHARPYYQRNKAKCNNARRVNLQSNLAAKIGSNLRRRVNHALRSQSATRSNRVFDLVGCSIQDLIDHIKSLFTEGMSLEKFMQGEIHLDHVIPCCAFDLSRPDLQIKCFNWRNLQPMWAKDNCRKQASFDPENPKQKSVAFLLNLDILSDLKYDKLHRQKSSSSLDQELASP